MPTHCNDEEDEDVDLLPWLINQAKQQFAPVVSWLKEQVSPQIMHFPPMRTRKRKRNELLHPDCRYITPLQNLNHIDPITRPMYRARPIYRTARSMDSIPKPEAIAPPLISIQIIKPRSVDPIESIPTPPRHIPHSIPTPSTRINTATPLDALVQPKQKRRKRSDKEEMDDEPHDDDDDDLIDHQPLRRPQHCVQYVYTRRGIKPVKYCEGAVSSVCNPAWLKKHKYILRDLTPTPPSPSPSPAPSPQQTQDVTDSQPCADTDSSVNTVTNTTDSVNDIIDVTHINGTPIVNRVEWKDICKNSSSVPYIWESNNNGLFLRVSDNGNSNSGGFGDNGSNMNVSFDFSNNNNSNGNDNTHISNGMSGNIPANWRYNAPPQSLFQQPLQPNNNNNNYKNVKNSNNAGNE